MELTKQEKAVIALMRGQNLNKEELKTAKQQVHIMNMTIKNWKFQYSQSI